MPPDDAAPPPANSAPGLPCPQCGFVIRMTIEMLLTQPAVYCTRCGLELTLDRDASAASLKALERLNQSLQRAEQLKKDALKGP